MKANVYFVSLHPQWVPQIHGHKNQLAAKHGRQVQAFADVLNHRFVKAAFEARWQLAQVKRAHMHWHFGGFKVQKRGI